VDLFTEGRDLVACILLPIDPYASAVCEHLFWAKLRETKISCRTLRVVLDESPPWGDGCCVVSLLVLGALSPDKDKTEQTAAAILMQARVGASEAFERNYLKGPSGGRAHADGPRGRNGHELWSRRWSPDFYSCIFKGLGVWPPKEGDCFIEADASPFILGHYLSELSSVGASWTGYLRNPSPAKSKHFAHTMDQFSVRCVAEKKRKLKRHSSSTDDALDKIRGELQKDSIFLTWEAFLTRAGRLQVPDCVTQSLLCVPAQVLDVQDPHIAHSTPMRRQDLADDDGMAAGYGENRLPGLVRLAQGMERFQIEVLPSAVKPGSFSSWPAADFKRGDVVMTADELEWSEVGPVRQRLKRNEAEVSAFFLNFEDPARRKIARRLAAAFVEREHLMAHMHFVDGRDWAPDNLANPPQGLLLLTCDWSFSPYKPPVLQLVAGHDIEAWSGELAVLVKPALAFDDTASPSKAAAAKPSQEGAGPACKEELPDEGDSGDGGRGRVDSDDEPLAARAASGVGSAKVGGTSNQTAEAAAVQWNEAEVLDNVSGADAALLRHTGAGIAVKCNAGLAEILRPGSRLFKVCGVTEENIFTEAAGQQPAAGAPAVLMPYRLRVSDFVFCDGRAMKLSKLLEAAEDKKELWWHTVEARGKTMKVTPVMPQAGVRIDFASKLGLKTACDVCAGFQFMWELAWMTEQCWGPVALHVVVKTKLELVTGKFYPVLMAPCSADKKDEAEAGSQRVGRITISRRAQGLQPVLPL
jgi:hypothetical protein